jgi:hypothetical protein
VVARAVADAKAGDQAARNWLGKYLIGSNGRTLLNIAAAERVGCSPADDIYIETGNVETLDDEDEEWSEIDDDDEYGPES